VIIGQLAVTFLLTKGSNTVSSNLANSLDHAWEEELKSPGAMSLYENWVNLSLVLSGLIFYSYLLFVL